MKEEQWKPAPGLKGLYEISNVGHFRRTGSTQLRHLVADKNGYQTSVAYLGKTNDIKCVKMHRLVVGAFIGEIPDGMVVNHKNGLKADNRTENLEVITPAQNSQHSFNVLGRKGRNSNPSKGIDHHNSRFTESDIRKMRALYEKGHTQVEIAKCFQTRQCKISEIVLRKAWKHIA